MENQQEPFWASMDDQHPRGVPVLKTDRYWLYGEEREDGLHITGVRNNAEYDLDEVYIPAEVDGRPVMGLHMNWTFDPEFPHYVKKLHFPDCIPGMNGWELRYVENVAVIPTDRPCYQVKEGMLLTPDGKKLVMVYDRRRTEIDVPDGVEVIGEDAFFQCHARWLWLPESLREIEREGFAEVHVRSLVIPEGVRRIGSGAFRSSSMISIILPDELEELGPGAMSDSSVMEVTIPHRIRELEGTFTFCSNLRRVHLPEGLEKVGDGTFECCENLRSVTLPSTLRIIGRRAFANCEELQHIEMPEGVQIMDMSVFVGCENLQDLILPGQSRDGVLYDVTGTVLLRWPKERGGECVVPEGVTEIADNAFESARELTRVVLPESLRRLGNHVFANCTALKEIVFPDGVEKIGRDCFRGCDSLKKLILPGSVQEMDKWSFFLCKGLELLRLPESMRNVDFIIKGCESLKVIELPMRGEVTVDVKNLILPHLPVLRVYRDTPVHQLLLRHNAESSKWWQTKIEVMD
ncbi:MAG: leucine-rich repeat domain-containing protein [Clostridia bacterium]|nr:leucine-rich repeat domain-containing protein [Clostridia bacterium]